MIDMIGATSALSRVSGPGDTEVASAAGMVAQTAGSAMSGTSASFGEVLASLGEDVMQNLRTAETNSFAAVRGEIPTRQVVDAMMTAEQSLQAAIAIRDKLVTAYLEIARMQI